MVETELTLKALTYAKEHFSDKTDECGKPIIDRLLFVAERMNDEVTTCAALLQEVDMGSLIEYNNFLSEFSPLIIDTASAAHFDPYYFFDYLDDPFDVFIRSVMTNETVEKVVHKDLLYRINRNNYTKLTATLLSRIQAYRKAYVKLDEHLNGKPKSDAEDLMRSAVVTDCCGKIVHDYSRYCPVCGKKIDKNTVRHLRYKFDEEATKIKCRHCGEWLSFVDRYCTQCGHDLHEKPNN